MQNSVFYEEFLPRSLESSLVRALRNTVNVWDHMSRVTSWCLEQFGWSACSNIVSGFRCLHATFNLWRPRKKDPGILKIKKKKIYSSHFYSVTSNLTWISRKIIFPTRNIETRTRDFRPAHAISSSHPRLPTWTRDIQPATGDHQSNSFRN